MNDERKTSRILLSPVSVTAAEKRLRVKEGASETLVLQAQRGLRLTTKHVIQADFRSKSEFLVSDLIVNNGSFPLINATNDSPYFGDETNQKKPTRT